jgi:hypothetical protein
MKYLHPGVVRFAKDPSGVALRMAKTEAFIAMTGATLRMKMVSFVILSEAKNLKR